MRMGGEGSRGVLEMSRSGESDTVFADGVSGTGLGGILLGCGSGGGGLREVSGLGFMIVGFSADLALVVASCCKLFLAVLDAFSRVSRISGVVGVAVDSKSFAL